MPLRPRSSAPAALAVLLAVVLALSGCGSKSAKDLGDPATVLNAAEQKLADTSGVVLTLSTPALPDGVEGIRGASGTVTDTPAFDGTLTVVITAGSFAVPVRSVGGHVYAQIPLTPGWSKVNPSDYGAPDPAYLTDKTRGLPAILAGTTDARAGDDVRGGTDNKEVFTVYRGTVPGSAVSNIIPGAQGDFEASYEIDSSGELRQATLTGAFYSGKPSLVYTLTLADYGTTKDITAP